MSDKTENPSSPIFIIQPSVLSSIPNLEMAECKCFEMLTEGRVEHWQAILAIGFYFSRLSHSWLGFPSLSKYIGRWYMRLLLPTLLSICYRGTIPA